MSQKILNSAELRVLGAMIEKEATTPEYYPLTLNALIAACNQKTNRWPVTNLEEFEVSEALRSLRTVRYSVEISGAGMRVPKHAQRFTETLNLGRRETAILCVLMLRGPQTLGEIKDRTERLHAFADLDEVALVLGKLSELDMAKQLPRLAGQKESRYAQLLAGLPDAAVTESISGPVSPSRDRIELLEMEVNRLREEVDELRRRLDAVL